jgi:hypothetical protein
MKKIDLKKELKSLYLPSAKAVALVEVPTMNYLMIDGAGDPNTSKAYAEAIETLYAVAYAVKFSVRKSQEIDYGVLPLESLWWADDMAAFTTGDRAKWQWTAMIMQPSFVTAKIVAEAVADVKKKKNPAALGKLRFASLAEGTCAQTLHVGPFSEEGPTIERVHEFICARGATLTGKHHEIYLSDLRKAAPEKWKTVVRQPLALRTGLFEPPK